jgi:hypothetical protein
MKQLHEPPAGAGETTEAVVRRQEADAERRLAQRGPEQAPRPRAARPPGRALQLPIRAPGRTIGDVAVHAAVRSLHGALVRHTRGWPAKRLKRLEAALVELEAAVDDTGAR